MVERFEVSRWIYVRMMSRGWTQAHLARHTGLSPDLVRDYVTGQRQLTTLDFDRIIAALTDTEPPAV